MMHMNEALDCWAIPRAKVYMAHVAASTIMGNACFAGLRISFVCVHYDLGHLSFGKPFASLLFSHGQWRRNKDRNSGRDIAVFLEACLCERQLFWCKERVPWL